MESWPGRGENIQLPKAFIVLQFAITRMNVKIIPALSIIFMMLICGCFTNNQLINDDLYLENLSEFSGQYNQIVSSNEQPDYPFLQLKKKAADLKMVSITYYDNVAALNVSPEFKVSQNSFLQSMNALESVSVYILNPSYREKSDDMSESERLEALDQDENLNNFMDTMIGTYDPNVCSAAKEKYVNITLMCGVIPALPY